MNRFERDLAHVAFYEGRGRTGDYRHRHEAQVEFLSAYDEEYEPPQGTRIPRRSKLPDFWPVPACILAALAVRYHREAALVALFALAIVGASLAIAYAYHGCRKAWPDVRALWRRLPDALGDVSLVVGCLIAAPFMWCAWHAELALLRWQVISHIAIEMPSAYRPLPPLTVPEAPALAFELDLANPEAFTAVAPF